MKKFFKKEWPIILAACLFGILALWWVALYTTVGKDDIRNQIFSAVYGILALYGAVWGFYTATKWGGFKSFMGKSLLFFSFGLFAQEFGQLAYSYYLYYCKFLFSENCRNKNKVKSI